MERSGTKWRPTTEARNILAAGLAVIVALFVFNAHCPSALLTAELKIFDLRMHARKRRKPSGEVAIVAIDEKSIVELGPWPWPREVLARLTDSLRSYHAAVLGFDMVFSEVDYGKEEGSSPSRGDMAWARRDGQDETFAEALRSHGNSFLGYPLQVTPEADGELGPGFVTELKEPPPQTFSSVQVTDPASPPPLTDAIAYLPNLPVIDRAARGSGFLNAPADPDGIHRSELMVIQFGNLYCAPFVLAIARAYAEEAHTSLTLGKFGVARVAIGATNIPVDEQGRMLVNFRGPAHTFPYYSASDVIARRVVTNALAGKIVLVGASAHDLGDRLPTPMGANFPGVELHANAIDNILAGDFIQGSDSTVFLELLAALVMDVTMSAAVAYLGTGWSGAALAGMIFSYLALAQYLLVADGLLVGLLFPILSSFITYGGLTSYRLYLIEKHEKVKNPLVSHAVGQH